MNAQTEGYRLSPQQRRLWRLGQDGGAYRAQCAIHLEGDLDALRLRRALEYVVRRHEILRTNFRYTPGLKTPVQVVGEDGGLSWEEVDLSHLQPPAQAAGVDELSTAETCRVFDLEHGPLLRARLCHVGDAAHLLLLTLPALCADARTLQNLFLEISRAYAAEASDGETADEPMQYVDFAEWQNQLLEDADAERGRDFWSRQALTAGADFKLPLQLTRNTQEHFTQADYTARLESALVNKLEAAAHRRQVPLALLMLACWQTLLQRLTNGSELSIGMLSDGRKYEEMSGVLGPLAKWLPVVCQFGARTTFNEAVAQTARVAREITDWQEYFSWEAHDTSNGDTPYSVGFEFAEQPPAREVAGLRLSLKSQLVCSEQFSISLRCVRTAEALAVEFHYDAEVFTAEQVARLGGQFLRLLENALDNPDLPVVELELLDTVERQQVLLEWNDTSAPFPAAACLHHLFEAQVLRTPEQTAATFHDQRLTYVELNQRANQLARQLQSMGVGPEVIVGIFVERSLDMIVALLGVLKAGGAYAPLDLAAPRARLAAMIEDAQVSVVLTQQHLAGKLPPSAAQVICLDTDWETISRLPSENPANDVSPHNLAYIIYTSGSTGRPKGVMIPHRGLVNYLSWCKDAYAVADGRGTPVNSQLSFDLTITSLFSPLLVGRSITLLDEDQALDALVAALSTKTDFSLVKITPAHLEILNHRLSPTEVARRTRALVIGGEALTGESLSFWRSHAPGTRLINEYGPTETVVGCCIYEVPAGAVTSGRVPIGRPIANTQAYVLDAFQRPVPLGVTGELYIGGEGVARGYHKQPGPTAERFIPHPFSPLAGARLYRTGDMARHRADGQLEFLGRADEQVKVRGYRVELGEIEAVLLEHEAVREVAVVVRDDERCEHRLVAYFVPRDGAEPPEFAETELRRHLAERLPDYMLPTSFVTLERLPLTPNGKLDRRALPAPAPLLAAGGYVAPRTPVEELLAALFAEVLGVERVGVEDDFFELGGHSLLATQMVARARREFGARLEVREVFEARTVSGLARVWAGQQRVVGGVGEAELKRAERGAAMPLSFAQQRLWFLDRLEPDSPFYNINSVVRITGALDAGALRASLDAVVARHEALRTTFALEGEAPVQHIHASLALPLPVEDLRTLEEPRRTQAVEAAARQAAEEPFALDRWPLLRARLLRVGEEEYVLLLVMHHIISDGWSLGVLVRELRTLYAARVGGEGAAEAPLPELPVQYADYAVWQRGWLRGEELARQISFWRRQLAGAPAVLELPTDKPRPTLQTYAGAKQAVLLPPSLTGALKTLSRREGVTLFMTLLAAFKTLLYRYTGQTDVLVGTPIAGRNRVELEPLVGFFVNTLVMRTSLAGDPPFTELLRRIREVALDAYAYQDMPFEKLVEELQPERDLSHTPFVQVMLVMQNAPREALELPGLTLQPLSINSGTAKFDLTLALEEGEHGLNGNIEYNTDLFTSATIERMAAHLALLLNAVVADPQQRLSEIPFLAEAEQHQLLVEWNDTRTTFETQDCLHELFEAQTRRTPDALAVSDDAEQLTYTELNQRANRLAHYLRGLRAGPESRAGILLERGVGMVTALLGVLKAGGAYLPLDPKYPAARLAYMLADAEVSVLITQEPLLSKVTVPPATRIVYLDVAQPEIAAASAENPVSGVTADNLAYVIYTSGSTGQSKGVMVTHRGICNTLHWRQSMYRLNENDRVLQNLPFTFDPSVWQFFAPLATGAAVVLAEPDRHYDTAYLVKLIAEQKVTTVQLPPSILQVFLAEPGLEHCRDLKHFISGGEAVTVEIQEQFYKRLKGTLHHLYGPTEASIDATYHVCDPASIRQFVPIGRPIANTEIYLLDVHMRPVPVGITAELYIGGEGLARGYLSRPALTAERFIPNPFADAPGARLYRTGDVARYLADGQLQFLGRVDEQVKVRGYRIELGEVEAVLAQHPAVKETAVAVSGVTAAERRLVAYVVGRNGAPAEELTVTALRQHLGEQLPEYMIPSVFMMLEALPRTSNGKLDRRALPAPAETRPALEASYVSPRTEVEQSLATVWQEILKVEHVGVNDNFFELGGHSLLLVQLHTRLEAMFKRELAMVEMFRYPTVGALAAYLTGGAEQPVVLERASENVSLRRIQQRAQKQKEMARRQKQLSKKRGA